MVVLGFELYFPCIQAEPNMLWWGNPVFDRIRHSYSFFSFQRIVIGISNAKRTWVSNSMKTGDWMTTLSPPRSFSGFDIPFSIRSSFFPSWIVLFPPIWQEGLHNPWSLHGTFVRISHQTNSMDIPCPKNHILHSIGEWPTVWTPSFCVVCEGPWLWTIWVSYSCAFLTCHMQQCLKDKWNLPTIQEVWILSMYSIWFS